jgi:hypothetical protein
MLKLVYDDSDMMSDYYSGDLGIKERKSSKLKREARGKR